MTILYVYLYIYQIEQYYSDLVSALVLAAKQSVEPTSENKQCKPYIPGWNNHVKQLHASARRAFLTQIDKGKPVTNTVNATTVK